MQYTYISKRGRIPTAAWGRWGPSTYSGGDWWTTRTAYVFVPGSSVDSGGDASLTEECQVIELLDHARLRDLWECECGLDGSDTHIFYCGSGWRSALAWFLAVAVLGWKNCRNYDGGWLEYSQTSLGAVDHPIEQGA